MQSFILIVFLSSIFIQCYSLSSNGSYNHKIGNKTVLQFELLHDNKVNVRYSNGTSMQFDIVHRNNTHAIVKNGEDVLEFNIFGDAFNDIIHAIDGSADDVIDFFKDIGHGIKDFVKDIFDIIPDPCLDLCIPVFESVKKNRGLLTEIPQDILKTYIQVSYLFAIGVLNVS